METLKDAFTPFYERLRRPFVGAFWLSWLFVNWKLWVGLLFYKEVVYGVDKIVFINSHLTFCSLFLKPLFCALLFLFVMPILDVVAFWWQHKMRDKKVKIKREVDKTEKNLGYFELQNKYKSVSKNVMKYLQFQK